MVNARTKRIIIFIIMLLVIISISTISLALPISNIPNVTVAEEGKIFSIIGIILRIVRIVGVGIALIVLVVLAIKYMTSAPAERADIKKSLILYTVGALLLFGGIAFLSMIEGAGKDINSSKSTPPSVSTPEVHIT